jgi:hypothetical protein
MQEQRKRLEAMWWAGVFIWAGLIFGADSLGFLPQIGGADAWSWVFAGAGLSALVGAIFRVTSPDWPDPTAWDYIWAGILLIIGLGGFFNLEIGFPLILILIGVVILGSMLLRRE